MNKNILLILTLYAIITLGYGIINPLFEAPDEHRHFFTAVYIAENNKLPFVAENHDLLLGQEAAQPPLAYLVYASIISPIDLSTARQDIWYNPYGTQGLGNANALTNRNLFIHTQTEQWPWTGYVLAAHLLRIFTLFLGLGTLIFVYQSSRVLWPNNPDRQLLSTSLIAFLPQFNFQHATISNDAIIIFFCTATIWQLLWIWHNQTTYTRTFAIGVTIGLAALSKNAGILLLIFSIGFLLIYHLKTAVSWQKGIKSWSWQTAVMIVLPVVLIAGWLWWRNWHLYGDWTAANQFVQLSGGDRNFTLSQVLAESGGLWRSLFGVFGWANLLAPKWIYWIWNGLVALGIIGVVKNIVNWKFPKPITLQGLLDQSLPLLLAGWVAAVYAGLLLFMLRTPAAQGRLLFPALLPLSLGLTFGLSNWNWKLMPRIASFLTIISTLYCLTGVIAPAYAQSPILHSLPENASPLHLEMGEGLKLLGAELDTEVASPGKIIWMTLYWEAENTPNHAPELIVDLLGRDLTPVGSSRGYHGQGQFPASEWPESRIVADKVGIWVADEAMTPVLAQIFVQLRGKETSNNPTQLVGTVKISPQEEMELTEDILADIGNSVQIRSATLEPLKAVPGDVITIHVQWQVIAQPPENWTTLIHLAGKDQPPLATGDAPPLNGEYPTHVWEAGEVFSDNYRLTIPDDLANGRYPLWLGMYNSNSGERLPLTVNNIQQPHQIYQIGTVKISSP